MLQSQLYGQSRLPNASITQNHQLVQHHLTCHYEGVARTYGPQAGLTAGVEIAETAEKKSTVEVSTSTISGVARSVSDGDFVLFRSGLFGREAWTFAWRDFGTIP
jgi:hypothetical protein